MCCCLVSPFLHVLCHLRLFLQLISLILVESAFKEAAPINFCLYNSFAVFVYSQLQCILPDSYLSKISDRVRCLSIDLSSPDLPLKRPTEFLRNEDIVAWLQKVKFLHPRISWSRQSASKRTFALYSSSIWFGSQN